MLHVLSPVYLESGPRNRQMHMNALDSRGCLRGVGEFLAEVPIADGTPFIKGLWDFTPPPSRPTFLFGDFNVQACSTTFSENVGSKYV